MPRSRKSQASLIDTPSYYCVTRCVRRSFLCGVDNYSGKTLGHPYKTLRHPLICLLIYLYDEQDITLQTPVRHNMTNPLPKAERTCLNKTRRLVETVISQLTGQFKMNYKENIRTSTDLFIR
ncbi:MAG: hypothetical protein ACJASU_001317 [Cognaticolwellia sp.]